MSEAPVPAGGRGARERILTAATALFYEQGIGTTGMKRLTEAAHVSTRTFYQHFAGKDDLIAEYLARWDTEHLLAGEASLARLDRPARERLLGLFATPPEGSSLRGCPFHNAAVEAPGLNDAARALVVAHKQHFLGQVVAAAGEAGADDPERLGRQLAVLHEGTRAWCTSTGDRSAFAPAQQAAATLLDLATARPPR